MGRSIGERRPCDRVVRREWGRSQSVVVGPVADDVHRRLFGRRRRAVDTDVASPQLLVAVADPAVARRDEPPGADLAHLVVPGLAVGVGGVADAVAVVRRDVGQLTGQVPVDAVALRLLAGGDAPPVAHPWALRRGVALVERIGDAVVEGVLGAELSGLVVPLVGVGHVTLLRSPEPSRPWR